MKENKRRITQDCWIILKINNPIVFKVRIIPIPTNYLHLHGAKFFTHIHSCAFDNSVIQELLFSLYR